MSFHITGYTITDKRITAPLRAVYLSDLHGKVQKDLAARIQGLNPDLILLGGDMISRKYAVKTLVFLRQLKEIAPVFYGYGNHEARRQLHHRQYAKQARQFMDTVKKMGITVLNDETVKFSQKTGPAVSITGLTLPLACYKRFRAIRPRRVPLPSPDGDGYQILLAHTPSDPLIYARWGADLTLCGHYHGGVMRMGHRGLITPQMHLFERYAYGCFDLGLEKHADKSMLKKHLIVTSGLGTHMLPPRILNPAEVVCIDLKPQKNSETID